MYHLQPLYNVFETTSSILPPPQASRKPPPVTTHLPNTLKSQVLTCTKLSLDRFFFRSVPRTIWVVDLALNQSQYLDPPLPSVADSFRKCIGDKSATSGICMFFFGREMIKLGERVLQKKYDLEITKVHHALCNRFSPGLLVHIFGGKSLYNSLTGMQWEDFPKKITIIENPNLRTEGDKCPE